MQKAILIVLTIIAGMVAVPAALASGLQVITAIFAIGTGQVPAGLTLLLSSAVFLLPLGMIFAAWWLRRQGSFIAAALLLALPIAAAGIGFQYGAFGPFRFSMHEWRIDPPPVPDRNEAPRI